MRRLLALGLVLATVPTGAALLVVRPAAAEVVGYDSVATTAIVTGVSVYGDVGASGGLATLDGGTARVVASLDGSPSGHVIAAPYEPGGLVRTLVGQANTSAGQQVFDVPDAEAPSPGKPAHDSVEFVPGQSAGPLVLVGGTATADASPSRVAGSATGASLAAQGIFVTGGSTSSVELKVDAVKATVAQTATAAIASLDVMGGLLSLSDVQAQVRITTLRDTHAAQQSLTIGGASVAGQAVVIGNDGVTAVGTPLLPGQTLADATAQASAALAQAGVEVHTVGGTAKHDDRSASADTGGVLITVKTPDLPVGGVAGNTLTLLVGQASLTELDSLAAPFPICICVPPVATQQPPATTTTTFVPGTPGTPALPGATAAGPTIAPAQPVAYVVAGRRFSARAALLAFAVWQLLTLGIPTMYALVERRRRVADPVPA
jgi:hypothetical protein